MGKLYLQTVTEESKLVLDEGVWVPDLEIYGLEKYTPGSVIKTMSGVRIRRNHMIEFNARVTVTTSCRMMFETYPFDRHICLFQVGSCELVFIFF